MMPSPSVIVLPPVVGTSWALPIDEVAAYDVWTPEFVSEFAEVEIRDAAIAKRRPVRVVVHDVVQDLYVVSSLCINATAGFVVDRVVLDRDVVGHGTLPDGLMAMPFPSRLAFPLLYPANACAKV